MDGNVMSQSSEAVFMKKNVRFRPFYTVCLKLNKNCDSNDSLRGLAKIGLYTRLIS